jgi:hypothetical protein
MFAKRCQVLGRFIILPPENKNKKIKKKKEK